MNRSSSIRTSRCFCIVWEVFMVRSLVEQKAKAPKSLELGPLVFQAANAEDIGETYPPTPDKILKFTRDISFSNFQQHQASRQNISSPPIDQPNEGQMDVPQSLKREIQIVMEGIWGRQFSDNDMKTSSHRICW